MCVKTTENNGKLVNSLNEANLSSTTFELDSVSVNFVKKHLKQLKTLNISKRIMFRCGISIKKRRKTLHNPPQHVRLSVPRC